jgi:hypothetical protein
VVRGPAVVDQGLRVRSARGGRRASRTCGGACHGVPGVRRVRAVLARSYCCRTRASTTGERGRSRRRHSRRAERAHQGQRDWRRCGRRRWHGGGRGRRDAAQWRRREDRGAVRERGVCGRWSDHRRRRATLCEAVERLGVGAASASPNGRNYHAGEDADNDPDELTQPPRLERLDKGEASRPQESGRPADCRAWHRTAGDLGAAPEPVASRLGAARPIGIGVWHRSLTGTADRVDAG